MVAHGHLATHALISEPTWAEVIPARDGLDRVQVTIFGKQSHAGWRCPICRQGRCPDHLRVCGWRFPDDNKCVDVDSLIQTTRVIAATVPDKCGVK